MDKHPWKPGGARLTGLAAALLLVVSSAAVAQGGGEAAAAARSNSRQIDRWNPYIEAASARFGIPEEWIRRVMRAESGGRTTLNGRPITSRAGALGLMQLMPGTWAEMRLAHGLGSDPHDPRDNILAGAAYLRAMHDRFGYPGLFAAYNAGPVRYAEHLATGRRLPAETLAYVAAIGPGPTRGPAASSPQSRSSGLFVGLVDAGPRPVGTISPPNAHNSLFVRLSRD